MRRFLAAIVGTPLDLDLRNRWWHRLALVVFVLVTVFSTLAAAAARGGMIPADLAGTERVVTTDLLSFTGGFEGPQTQPSDSYGLLVN
jgi:hypothetical protein